MLQTDANTVLVRHKVHCVSFHFEKLLFPIKKINLENGLLRSNE